jgi:hypothetical protein
MPIGNRIAHALLELALWCFFSTGGNELLHLGR